MTDRVVTDKPEIPLPTPSDVDVSDMKFMPMIDTRLMKSRAWLTAKNWRGEGPGLAFVLMNLWIAAFRTVPAGSLEDDDDMLADAAKVSIEHWMLMKDKALRGWERHGGRVWHRVVCELAWELWLNRLEARHRNALDSWRHASKRATDKGQVPPDPPGPQDEWLSAKYPATAAYQSKLWAASSAGCPPDKQEKSSDIGPKRSEAKEIPPVIPQTGPADTGKEGALERRRWYAGELTRLRNEFGPMVPVMLMNLQAPGVGGEFGLVQNFKNCWLSRTKAGPEIVAASKKRADAIRQQHGPWLAHYWPGLQVRHARIDELRARKAA